MTKLYRPFIKGTNWALAGLMGLLGFSCSNENDDDGGGWVEYGSPHATYIVKGKVIDKETDAPINDMQVIVQHGAQYDYQYGNDTVRTSATGVFSSTFGHGSIHEEAVRVITLDDKNDAYKPDTAFVSFKDAEFKNPSGSWFYGTAEKEITITLEKEEKE